MKAGSAVAAALVVGIALVATACRVVPWSAEELATAQNPDRVLVKYLAQHGADPAVCDADRDGPAHPLPRAATVAKLRRSKEKFEREKYAACLAGLAGRVPGPATEALLGGARDALRDGADPTPFLDGFEAATARTPLTPEAAARASAKLTQAARHADPATRARVDRVRDALDASAGLYAGAPVDRAVIAAQSDEGLLERWAVRLPDPTLAAAAGARLLDLRLADSPFSAVKADPDGVRRALAEVGYAAVPEGRALTAMRWEPGPDAPDLLRVIQQPRNERVALVLSSTDRKDRADPALDLRAGLRFEVEGYERLLGLCTPNPYDPIPCWPAERLALSHLTAWLDGNTLRFRDELSVPVLVDLLAEGTHLRLPITTAGARVELRFALHLDPVAPWEFTSAKPGAPGPLVKVDATELAAGRVLYRAESTGDQRYLAVVPYTDVGFRIVSRGGKGPKGADGADGSDGSDGVPGRDAMCPSSSGSSGGPGGNGGPGGDGGPGGTGGPGGPVTVVLRCASCDVIEPIVRRVVRSEGGRGGEGGDGGRGGAGGRGGRAGGSTNCSGPNGFYTLYGGSPGADGLDGTSGRPGPRGPDGPDGEVRVRVVADRGR